ncbi:uncharacterized protein LOC131306793 [Rhododendron vialii]|uniref:uncharacterized protein LOC131306793 n=1 Tax=Rhododendron vialii TaxID=182163 RepID=UPI00265ED3EB|nr:uncharacterized protein LOC131306793 [Rhododendron vialii]
MGLYILRKLALIEKLARWLLLLAEFDLKYMTKKSVKKRAVAELLADHPVTEAEVEDFMVPDEDILLLLDNTWQFYFDGASNPFGYSIEILLVSPNDSHVPLSYKLRFEVTNNQAKYEVSIAGMEEAMELGAKRLEVIGDSNLAVSQARGDWKVKEDTLKFYHSVLVGLQHPFNVGFHGRNILGFKMRPLMIEQRIKPTCECAFIEEDDDEGKPWYKDMKGFLERGEYPLESTPKDKMARRKFATQFVMEHYIEEHI